MTKILLSVVGWEERCSIAFERVLASKKCTLSLVFGDRRYEDRSINMRKSLQAIALRYNVELEFSYFDFDDAVSAFKTIQSHADAIYSGPATEIHFDISTAPRNIIWSSIAALQPFFAEIGVYYLPAKEYGKWQTREDKEPKLILNRSGIMYPDKPTCLILMCGWELSRAEKVIYKFEPRKILLLRDIDAGKYGEIQTVGLIYKSVVEEIQFDNKDWSEANVRLLCAKVQPLVDEYNIICCSFGPKLGSIVLYRLATSFDSIGLAYVPAGDHNPNISTGIGEEKSFQLGFDCLLADKM